MKRLVTLFVVVGVMLVVAPALAQDSGEESTDGTQLVPQETAGEDQYGPGEGTMSAEMAAAIRHIAVEAAETALKDDSGADDGVAAYTAAMKAARSAGADEEFAAAAAERAVRVADKEEPDVIADSEDAGEGAKADSEDAGDEPVVTVLPDTGGSSDAVPGIAAGALLLCGLAARGWLHRGS